MTAEHSRLEEAREQNVPWKKWGPYLSERQWGTVREDYSNNGDAWNFFTIGPESGLRAGAVADGAGAGDLDPRAGGDGCAAPLGRSAVEPAGARLPLASVARHRRGIHARSRARVWRLGAGGGRWVPRPGSVPRRGAVLHGLRRLRRSGCSRRAPAGGD